MHQLRSFPLFPSAQRVTASGISSLSSPLENLDGRLHLCADSCSKPPSRDESWVTGGCHVTCKSGKSFICCCFFCSFLQIPPSAAALHQGFRKHGWYFDVNNQPLLLQIQSLQTHLGMESLLLCDTSILPMVEQNPKQQWSEASGKSCQELDKLTTLFSVSYEEISCLTMTSNINPLQLHRHVAAPEFFWQTCCHDMNEEGFIETHHQSINEK